MIASLPVGVVAFIPGENMERPLFRWHDFFLEKGYSKKSRNGIRSRDLTRFAGK